MKIIMNFMLIAMISGFVVSNLNGQQLTRDQLIEDARQLKNLIESCHPDPYLNTGGKIGFNLSFYEMLNKIPEKGMDTDDFWWLLSGFLAGMEDGHTFLFPASQPDYSNPGGIPWRFRILADSSIVVTRVSNPEHLKFIGCHVLNINKVEAGLLLKEVANLYPMENYFDHFRNLQVYLWYSDYMKRLFPGWEPGEAVEVLLEKADGKTESLTLSTGANAVYKTIGTEKSIIDLPATTRCDFVFDWLRADKSTAYMCLSKQDEFREYAKQMHAGLKTIQDPSTLEAYRNQYLEVGHQYYERYNGKPGPDSLELLIDGMPSFTELMKDVVYRLKENNTQNLIIDLRNNSGGVSLMSEILVYFLYGKEKMAALENDSYSITYLSDLNTKTASSVDVDATNREYSEMDMVPLETGDYDFFPMYKYKGGSNDSHIPASRYEDAGIFYKEYVSGLHSGFYTPENIFVIGGPDTFSAGFETLVKLLKSGAIFAGVSAAQPANCFGMAISPVSGLKNSKIKLNVAIRRIVMFPGDPEKGYQLNPDIPLSLDTFRKYNCDPNASLLMVLDRIEGAQF
jgi:hypothetical protein